MTRRNIGKLTRLVAVDDLSVDMMHGLIHRALAYKGGATYRFLEPKFVANLFYEHNTKSHYSFEMAQHRLGLKVLSFDPQSSSAYKGESMYDAGMMMSMLGIDVVVSASESERYYEKWLENETFSSIVINAGDGDHEDPCHALTDAMTIYEHFGTIEGLKVGFIGATHFSRVTKSTVKVLNQLGAQVFFSGPEQYQSRECHRLGRYLQIDEMIPNMDVIVILRVQSEREDVAHLVDGYYEQYGMTVERLAKLKENAILLHPGPVKRDVEIANEGVECAQSKIFIQGQNSVYMNMAILEAVLA
ncbi:aspartate carbamoyltransferase [Carnobacteriaceae bacterium zg-ZUI252]|nr:aspartate carbamoyltransferase [Carnobacteriaceae bacterium zg-ZUI252]